MGLPGIRVLGVGAEVNGFRLWFDCHGGGGGLTLVSHAHSDHLPATRSEALATPETVSILKAIGRRFRGRILGFGEKAEIGEATVSAEPSGHVLGSSQFIVEADGERLVYTGDLNTYDSILLKAAKPLEADKLIIGSTYGLPSYVFPEREELYSQIVRWILRCIRGGEVPAFKVYALGKAQEIIGLVNAYLDIPAVVGWNVARISEKHLKHGVRLRYLPLHSEEGVEAFTQGECVYISSRRLNPPSKRRIRWAVATGWALRYRYPEYDAAFPLSGHTDYPGLLSYVEESRPKRVYVVHGYSEVFARRLRRMGWRAISLREGQELL